MAVLPSGRPRLVALSHPDAFRRVLARPGLAQSPHFALHYCADVTVIPPSGPERYRASAGTGAALGGTELSPTVAPHVPQSVDKSGGKSVDKIWMGYVVPKRLARRAVTRNLLKRQMRQAVGGVRLAHGVWVLKLRRPFEVERFPSAASQALKRAARQELAELMVRAGLTATRAPS